MAETCEIALDRIRFEQKKREQVVAEEGDPNPFASVDPAPPSKRLPTDQLLSNMMDVSKSLFERYRAMFALRNRADQESVLALTHGLKDSSALFRHEIAYVLGQLSHEASVPALVESLKDQAEHEMVRHECAEGQFNLPFFVALLVCWFFLTFVSCPIALGSIATPEVLPILQEYRNDQKRVVKESCDVALDMYEYENSNQFQYADGLAKVKE